MKKIKTIPLIVLLAILFVFPAKIYSQTNNSKTSVKMESTQSTKKTDATEQILIDKFFIPKNARQEFYERANVNRNFIKKLPGFIEDQVYERIDEQENLIVVTVAVWKNADAIKKAKEAVQAEYKKEGFDMQGMLKRLNIVIDRGVYEKIVE
jgi:heme-degrading monooxygenase HmoA